MPLLMDGLAKNELDLVNQIKTLYPELKINEHSIKNPTTIFVVDFYKYFLNDFYIDFSVISQIAMNQGAVIEYYSEMYTEITPLLNLTVAIRSFKIPALETFCVFDLTKPTPKRTFRHLAHVVHFINFADTRVGQLSAKFEKISDAQANRNTVTDNIESVKNVLSSQIKQMGDYPRKQNELCEKIKELNQELYELSCENDGFVQQLNIENANQNRLNVDDDKCTSELRTVENDIDEYNDQIKELNQLGSVKDEAMSTELLKEKIKELSEKCKEMTNTLKLKEESHDQHVHVSQALQELIESIKVYEKLSTEMQDIQKNTDYYSNLIEPLNEEIKAVETALLLKKNAINTNNEKLVDLQLQWKNSSDLRGVNNAKREYECQEKCVSENEAAINNLKSKIENNTIMVKENDDYYKQCMDNYTKLIELQNTQIETIFEMFKRHITDININDKDEKQMEGRR